MKIFSLALLFQFLAFVGLAQSKEVLNLELSKKAIGIIVVNTNLAKLTESIDADSKVLAILNAGQQLELLQIHFPFGTKNASRYEVRMGVIEGYISSYFISQNLILEENLVVKLKDFEDTRAKVFSLKEKQIQDSLTQVKIQREKEYMENRKSNLSISDVELGRKNDSIAEIVNRKSKLDAASALKKRRDFYINKYGPVNGEKVAKGLIWIGMTEQMLIDSWGQPEDINTTVTRYVKRKQYVYGSRQYVYVENGVVDAWQN